MLNFSIPGRDEAVEIRNLILDLNGTLAVDGIVVAGVKERLDALRDRLRLLLFTGDTQGNAAAIAEDLGLEVRVTPNAEAKAAQARLLDPAHTATIGNGRIDLELFRTVRLKIGVVQAEGAAPVTLLEADVVVPTITDALDLLLKPKRLIATLRS